jgi:hypothetical protein
MQRGANWCHNDAIILAAPADHFSRSIQADQVALRRIFPRLFLFKLIPLVFRREAGVPVAKKTKCGDGRVLAVKPQFYDGFTASIPSGFLSSR